MQLLLPAAAAINLVVTGDVGTSVVLAGLTVFNAVIGLRQEAKAKESLKALAQMMKTVARHNTIVSRAALPGPAQLRRYGIVVVLIIAVATIGILQRIFQTTELDLAPGQITWNSCDRHGAYLSPLGARGLPIGLRPLHRDRRRPGGACGPGPQAAGVLGRSRPAAEVAPFTVRRLERLYRVGLFHADPQGVKARV
jgi:hypothetical protein